MECLPPAHSGAAHSMISWQGEVMAWSAISDL